MTEINRLIRYIDYFREPNLRCNHDAGGYPIESEALCEFRRVLADTGFLLVFNWRAWLEENEVYRNLDHDIDENLQYADVETLRKLMTCYVRGDRFTEGLFKHVVLKGHVAKILLRLEEIAREETTNP
ncbi:DUF6508 domain-containing protein [Paenibacillus guangzhouensis]|uniref:DUF6508 domain-containing protein n=1 Tax=Paenibacillus guangzhouensis TaxID=1473112 RepID=UPI001D10F104|nr:DUF6508 domain-containing protein [Paenibacillus guangzhouensis]